VSLTFTTLGGSVVCTGKLAPAENVGFASCEDIFKNSLFLDRLHLVCGFHKSLELGRNIVNWVKDYSEKV
jgi:hypothetical protein